MSLSTLVPANEMSSEMKRSTLSSHRWTKPYQLQLQNKLKQTLYQYSNNLTLIWVPIILSGSATSLPMVLTFLFHNLWFLNCEVKSWPLRLFFQKYEWRSANFWRRHELRVRELESYESGLGKSTSASSQFRSELHEPVASKRGVDLPTRKFSENC